MLIYRNGHLLLEIRLDMSIHHVTKSNLICDVLASASGLELLSAFLPQMPCDSDKRFF